MIDFKTPYKREVANQLLDRIMPDDFNKDIDEEINPGFKTQFISSITKIGECNSLEDLKVYEILHESENDPRISLSKDSFRLLANYGVRKALVFFVSKKSSNYRLSLVAVDLKWDSGTRVQREYSNPRRYSFYLGPDSKTHTPNDFLLKRGLIKNTEDLVSRFDVEVVTRQFFSEYRKLYENVSRYLDKDHGFKNFAARNNLDIDTFSKKLLGQIIFCYFLQRKGWLGAPKDTPVNNGDKDFMRSLLKKATDENKNFFNDYLEYLFYDSLNSKPRNEDDYFRERFKCQIPFLNGGLFEPLHGYDWKGEFIHIPDRIFSNKDKTGILDIFDLYNFTVYEDDPIDREVSVDPEMLGKVFENLLPENIRKGQGAYYTPREIVHYMCQESLTNYLSTETQLHEDRVRTLVHFKDLTFEDSAAMIQIQEEEKALLITALTNIKVCDPACGSGAFLVGMLHEVASLRRFLGQHESEYKLKKETIQNCIYGVDIDLGAVEIAKLRLWLSLVVDYELDEIEPLPNLDYKIMCGNSLLEELVVGDESIKLFDERLLNVNKQRNKKEGLFNEPIVGQKSMSNRLEYLQNLLKEKEKQLIELHSQNKLTRSKKRELEEEVKNISKELKPKGKKIRDVDYHMTLFGDKAETYFSSLKELHKSYFLEYDSTKKQQIKKHIENIESEFIKSTINEKVQDVETIIKNLNMQNPEDRKRNAVLMKKKLEYLSIPNEISRSNVNPYFLWKLNFFEVFQEKCGFDVIIANPPYVSERNNKEMFRPIAQGYLGKFYQGKMDLFYFFFHLALNIGNEKSQNALISTNYYITASAAQKLRTDLKERAIIRNLINFNELKIFESALGQHNMITIFGKGQGKENIAYTCITQRSGITSHAVLKAIVRGVDQHTNYYKLKQAQIYEGKENYIRLGITEIDGILQKVQNRSIALVKVCEVHKGIETGQNSVFVFDKLPEFYKALEEKEKKLFKKFYKNSNILRNYISNSTKYLLYFQNDIDLNNFPNIKRYMLENRKRLESRAQIKRSKQSWYTLLWARDEKTFSKIPKIVTSYRPKINSFCYTEKEFHSATDTYFIINPKKEISLKFILAIINSKLSFAWLKCKGKLKGDILELTGDNIEQIPIPNALKEEQKPFIDFVDKILSLTRSDSYLSNAEKQANVKKLEHQIDQIVYKIYGLTKEQIEIVENLTIKSKSNTF